MSAFPGYAVVDGFIDADRADQILREPLPADRAFRTLDNVLATPHIGYVGEDLYRTFFQDAAATIGAWLDEKEGKKA
jgi:phosphoglycerate dehydrogenase-like enzyme